MTNHPKITVTELSKHFYKLQVPEKRQFVQIFFKYRHDPLINNRVLIRATMLYFKQRKNSFLHTMNERCSYMPKYIGCYCLPLMHG